MNDQRPNRLVNVRNLLHEPIRILNGKHAGRNGMVLRFAPSINYRKPFQVLVIGADRRYGKSTLPTHTQLALDDFENLNV